MKIWQLTPPNEEPTFPYIASEKEAHDYNDLFSNKFYTQKTVEPNFPMTIICNLKNADIGRLLFMEQEFWIFTEKAKLTLETLLGAKAEFLPLIPRKQVHKKISRFKLLRYRKAYKPLLQMIDPEPHYLLNIFDVKPLDVIDFDNSDFEYEEEKQEIYMTDALAFYPEKIKHAHLFKIMNHGKGLQMRTFISDKFKAIVEENQLTGLKFSAKHEDDGGNLVWQYDTDSPT